MLPNIATEPLAAGLPRGGCESPHALKPNRFQTHYILPSSGSQPRHGQLHALDGLRLPIALR